MTFPAAVVYFKCLLKFSNRYDIKRCKKNKQTNKQTSEHVEHFFTTIHHLMMSDSRIFDETLSKMNCVFGNLKVLYSSENISRSTKIRNISGAYFSSIKDGKIIILLICFYYIITK